MTPRAAPAGTADETAVPAGNAEATGTVAAVAEADAPGSTGNAIATAEATGTLGATTEACKLPGTADATATHTATAEAAALAGTAEATAVLAGNAEGRVVALREPLSFWGGVDPATGRIIDARHPDHGTSLSGAVVMMPTTRGSCTGSGVLLELALAGHAPAAFLFSEPEDVVTLGALVAASMFSRTIPVLRLSSTAYAAVSRTAHARITPTAIVAGGTIPVAPPAGPTPDASGAGARIRVAPPAGDAVALTPQDRAMLDGSDGPAVQQAARILVAMARQQGAAELVDVTRGHIDGCIYASPANLVFAEAMEALGARVKIPTTMNAISVDRENWQRQGVPPSFGAPAARLADAYVAMGARPTFTCSPYLLPDPPSVGEAIGWSESNAVIYANSVLGARTAKHPDFLDVCIALTGRAPRSGVYLDAARKARRIVDIDFPAGAGDAVWPLIGYLAGHAAPDVIPLLRGLADGDPSGDDLKALCAAFGTTSAAPMLHIEGVTPEADGAATSDAVNVKISRDDLVRGWETLNLGPAEIDLVAIGSPHASLSECLALADSLAGRVRHPEVPVIVTAGRGVIAAASVDGTLARLAASGVAVIPDLCWCSISRPVFPPRTRAVITTSGKYAHYGPGLSGCAVRLGTLADCIEAALTGLAPPRLPTWLE